MTNREFFSAIAANEALPQDLRDFASESIAKLDDRLAKRHSTPSKTAVANAPIKEAITAFVTAHGCGTAADIAAACDISTQKASALCRQLVEDGFFSVTEVKVPSKGKVKCYSLAQ